MKKRNHGDGSIEHRGGDTWRLRYRVHGRKFSKTVHANSKKEALAELRNVTSTVAKDQHVEPNRITLGAWIDQWLQIGAPGSRKKKVVSERTKDRYRELLDTHVRPRLGDRRLQALQPIEIDRLYVDLRSKVSDKTKRVLAKTTQHHIHIVFGACLNAAVRRGVLIGNPMKKIDVVPDADPRPGIALDEDELGRLVAGFREKSPALFPVVAVAAATGMRRNEVLALRWSDIDFEKRTVRVERAWEPSKAHGLRLKAPKTELGRRTIGLNAETVAMLANHRAAYQRILAGVPDGTDINLALVRLPQNALIFPANPRGTKDIDFEKPRDPRNTTKDFRRIATKLGFPDFWFHNLRHTHATHLLDRGVSVHRVAARIGEDAATLLKVYARLTKKKNDVMEDAVNALGTNIFAP
jgi:integrase